MKSAKLVFFSVVVCLLFSSLAPVSAVSLDSSFSFPFEESISFSDLGVLAPEWDNTGSVYMQLTFEGSTAYLYADISGNLNVTNITAIFSLLRIEKDGKYTILKVWPARHSSKTYLIFNEQHEVTQGFDYMLSVSFNCTAEGYTESIYLTTTNYCP